MGYRKFHPKFLTTRFFEVKDLNDQLYDEVLSGRKYLAKKELELSEAKQKLKVSDDFNKEISATAQTLKMECENSKTICEDLGKQVPICEDKFNLSRSAPDIRDKRSELEQKTIGTSPDLEQKTRDRNMSRR
ncbi:hypothetical protein QQ045_008591 [Rhodiola kirilowii]